MTVRIFHAEGVTQTGRRILVSAGLARKFSLTETLDPMNGRKIRCVCELKNEGGEEDLWQKRNLERKKEADPSLPTEPGLNPCRP